MSVTTFQVFSIKCNYVHFAYAVTGHTTGLDKKSGVGCAGLCDANVSGVSKMPGSFYV